MDSTGEDQKRSAPPAGHIRHTGSAAKRAAVGGRGRDNIPQPTAREAQVLQVLAEDNRREDAATRLDIELRTVDFRLGNLRRKAGVRYNPGLVYGALRYGWLLPPDGATVVPARLCPVGPLRRALILLAHDHGEKQIAGQLSIPCCRNLDRFLHDLRVVAEVDTTPGLVYRAVGLGWLPMPE